MDHSCCGVFPAAVALTSLTANTWPFAFLTLRSFLRKYLHRYTTTLGLFCSCAGCTPLKVLCLTLLRLAGVLRTVLEAR